MRCLVALVAGALSLALAPSALGAVQPIYQVGVSGNQIINESRAPVRLIGVNRGTFEFTCVSPVYGPSYKNGTHVGPVDAGAVNAIASWGVNAVRVPLNEDCWLGINAVKHLPNRVVRLHGAAERRAGAKLRRKYRAAVQGFVNRLNHHGIAVILDLHWSAPGSKLADGQLSMADKSHSIDFWRSVATRFGDNHDVIFDLFNEPVGISWHCLRDGGCRLPLVQRRQSGPAARATARGKATVVGMQKLLNVIRNTGAYQPVMVGGLDYSDDLRRWLQFEPTDPFADTAEGPQIIASFHNYGSNNPKGFLCHLKCWNQVIAPIAQHVPVVTGEFGQDIFNDPPKCGTGYTTQYMHWADQHGISYLAWWWFVRGKYDTDTCTDLVKNYGTGAPTPYGQPIHDHYLGLSEKGIGASMASPLN